MCPALPRPPETFRSAVIPSFADTMPDAPEDIPATRIAPTLADSPRSRNAWPWAGAFQTVSTMDERDSDAEAGEIFFLAKAIRELAAADKTVADRELKIREAVQKQMAAKAGEVEKIARKGGLSAEAVKVIKREILGMGD